MAVGATTAIKRAFLCVTVFVFGGFVGFLTDQRAESAPEPQLSAAEVVELRFPADWSSDTTSLQLASVAFAPDAQQLAFPPPSTVAVAAMGESVKAALFDASPLYGPAVAASESPIVAASERAGEPKLAATPKLASAPRPSVRPGAVLNDTQIATVKQRLKLTPDQERMWPAVESALRKIAYKKDRNAARTKTAQVSTGMGTGTIDPNSAEVEQLRSAAFPLVMSFNDEQKQEVRAFARIIGLESVATQF